MIIKPVATEDDEDGAMFEIFNRLNSGGMNLTPQEIRMSLYHSKFNVSLIKLNENDVWRNTILGKDIVDMRLNDVEAILRTLAMVHSREEYKTTISGFLNTFSNATKSFSQEDTDFFKKLWDSFMVACEGVHVEDFRTGASRLSITLFESVFYAACRSSVEQKIVNIPTITSEYLALLKADEIFIESSTGKTTRRDSVVTRTDRARALLQEYTSGQ
ncbi:hypothetical protein ACEV8O_22895 [Vibrio parahaemolyticus]|nr:hypothetical protein [Vibrio parahaemolyticus]